MDPKQLPKSEATLLSSNETVTMPIVEETLHVSKEVIETGTVRVRLQVEEATEEVPTMRVSHQASLSRRAMNIEVDAEYAPHQEGSEWVIPVFEYRPVVRLQLFLKEEIRVTQDSVEHQEVQKVAVQRQRVIAERRIRADGEWAEVDINSLQS